MVHYCKYTKYKCKLLKDVAEFKAGTILDAMRIARRITTTTWDEDNWYILDNERVVFNQAHRDNEVEILDEKTEDSEKTKKRSKK